LLGVLVAQRSACSSGAWGRCHRCARGLLVVGPEVGVSIGPDRARGPASVRCGRRRDLGRRQTSTARCRRMGRAGSDWTRPRFSATWVRVQSRRGRFRGRCAGWTDGRLRSGWPRLAPTRIGILGARSAGYSLPHGRDLQPVRPRVRVLGRRGPVRGRAGGDERPAWGSRRPPSCRSFHPRRDGRDLVGRGDRVGLRAG
jgi:hypothetical protein